MPERVLCECRPALRGYWKSWTYAALLMLVGVAALLFMGSFWVGCLFLVVAFAFALTIWVSARYYSSWTITSGRVIQRKGIIARYTSEVELTDIRSVQVLQPALWRLLGIGSVLISTAGQSGIEVSMSGIPNPQVIADLIRRERRAEGRSAKQVGAEQDDEPNTYVID